MLVHQLKDPVDNLLKLSWDIFHFDQHAIDDCSKGELVEVDRGTGIEGRAISSVDQGEVLDGKTIDSPKVVPPLEERGVNSASGQVLSHLINVHGIIFGVPERDILLLNIGQDNIMSNLHLESGCPGGKRRDHKVARCSRPRQFLVDLDHLGEQ